MGKLRDVRSDFSGRSAVRRFHTSGLALTRTPGFVAGAMSDDPNALRTDELKARVGSLRRYL